MWAENLEKSDGGVQHTQHFGALGRCWRGWIPECLIRVPVEEGAWDWRSANQAFNLSPALPRSNLGWIT